MKTTADYRKDLLGAIRLHAIEQLGEGATADAVEAQARRLCAFLQAEQMREQYDLKDWAEMLLEGMPAIGTASEWVADAILADDEAEDSLADWLDRLSRL